MLREHLSVPDGEGDGNELHAGSGQFRKITLPLRKMPRNAAGVRRISLKVKITSSPSRIAAFNLFMLKIDDK
jgi:hypothetical protein